MHYETIDNSTSFLYQHVLVQFVNIVGVFYQGFVFISLLKHINVLVIDFFWWLVEEPFVFAWTEQTYR